MVFKAGPFDGGGAPKSSDGAFLAFRTGLEKSDPEPIVHCGLAEAV
jgi:hypothetical protein